MKRYQSVSRWLQCRRRLAEGQERLAREAEIATCSCGAQVRFNGTEWIHSGPCKEEA